MRLTPTAVPTVRIGSRITIHSRRRADLAVSAIETNAPSSAGGVYLTMLFTRSPGGPYSDCTLAVARALCKPSRMNLLHALGGIGFNTRSETPGPTHTSTW